MAAPAPRGNPPHAPRPTQQQHLQNLFVGSVPAPSPSLAAACVRLQNWMALSAAAGLGGAAVTDGVAALNDALAASEAARLQAEVQNSTLRAELAATHERLAQMLDRRQRRHTNAAAVSLHAPEAGEAAAPRPRRTPAGQACWAPGVAEAASRLRDAPEPAGLDASPHGGSMQVQAQYEAELRRRARALGLSPDALFSTKRAS